MITPECTKVDQYSKTRIATENCTISTEALLQSRPIHKDYHRVLYNQFKRITSKQTNTQGLLQTVHSTPKYCTTNSHKPYFIIDSTQGLLQIIVQSGHKDYLKVDQYTRITPMCTISQGLL